MSRIAKGLQDPLFKNRRSRKIAKGGGLDLPFQGLSLWAGFY